MTTAIQKKETEERSVAFVPFMGKDAITLTVAMVKSFIASPTKSGALPTDRDCIKFVMLCKARRLNPFEGDAFMIGFDDKNGPAFSIITAHQAFLKRAEVNDEYDGMESGVIVENGGQLIDRIGDFTLDGDKLLGGWARVHFKKRTHPMEKRVKLATFNKGFGRWNLDAAGMIVKCAEADALRSAFPTMLGGMYVEQEMGTITAEEVTREPIAMTRELPAASESPAAAQPAAEPAQGQDNGQAGASVVTGKIEEVTRKPGGTKEKPWLRFGVKLDGVTYGTFDKTHGELAEKAYAAGAVVEIEYAKEGKYTNLVGIRAVDQVDEGPAPQEDRQAVIDRIQVALDEGPRGAMNRALDEAGLTRENYKDAETPKLIELLKLIDAA